MGDCAQRVAKQKQAHEPKMQQQIAQQGFDAQALQAAVTRHQALITPKLAAFVQQTGATLDRQDPWSLLASAFAQAEYFNRDLTLRENVFFIYKNPLYIQVSELLKQQTNRDADRFVQTLFQQFDPATEAQRWKHIEQRFAEEE